MSVVTCTRRVQFCAGHRVYGHESKCKNLHGHNYVALFEASCSLDSIGRVIDFSVLKDWIGGWIDRNWDHGFILWHNDLEAIKAVSMMKDQKLYLMPSNPTAENMADYLLRKVCPEIMVGGDVLIVSVTIWETENCCARADL